MSVNVLLRYSASILNQPQLITPDAAKIVLDAVGHRFGLATGGAVNEDASAFKGSRKVDGRPKIYNVDRRVAVITIDGILVNRGDWIGSYCDMVSYEGIEACIDQAVADTDVDGILLDINTGGGEAAGAFELSEYIAKANQKKPVVAFVNSVAASAGYALACGAPKIVSIKSGRTGSIGVLVTHVNEAEKDKKEGREFTIIHAGASKTLGNPHEPLSTEARAYIQSQIDLTMDDFVGLVASARSLPADIIRGLEAKTYRGQDALKIGLVDELGRYETAHAHVLSAVSARHSEQLGKTHNMAGNDNNAVTSAPVVNANSEADLESAKAKGFEEGRAAAIADFKAIADLEEAEGKPAEAILDLMVQGATPDLAKTALTYIPKVKVAAATEALSATAAAFHEMKMEHENAQPALKTDADKSAETDELDALIEADNRALASA